MRDANIFFIPVLLSSYHSPLRGALLCHTVPLSLLAYGNHRPVLCRWLSVLGWYCISCSVGLKSCVVVVELGQVLQAMFPFAQRLGDWQQFFQTCRFFRGCEISNIFWSLDVKHIYEFIFLRLKKIWTTVSFGTRSDEDKNLQSERPSTELPSSGNPKIYKN